MTKVLLDTDIGNDIDDAICLAYLLSQKDCELLGITTVTGEPEKRGMLASALCKAAGKEVPIFPGAASPLLISQRQSTALQAVALDKWEHETDFPEGYAIEFMRKTIRENPHEITLLAIGPLTNVALLFAVDPQIPFLLKELVMMNGVFRQWPRGPFPEWNASCDPHAAATIAKRSVPSQRWIGLDVTMQVAMAIDDFNGRFRGGLLDVVRDFANVWFRHSDRVVFHDPLASACIFDETVCVFEEGFIDVELMSERLMGMTYWTPDKANSRCKVAVDVNPERFFEHFFSVLRVK